MKEVVWSVFSVIFTTFIFCLLFFLIVGVPNTSDELVSDVGSSGVFYSHIYSNFKDSAGHSLINQFKEISYVSTDGYGVNKRSNAAWESCKPVTPDATVGESDTDTFYKLNQGSSSELLAPTP